MRRKSERTASKKGKASPEKKAEKPKRTKNRRRKQSSSTENESDEGSPVRELKTMAEAPKEAPTTPAKEETSPEENQESQDQVWQVKTAESSGDGGEIQKLKICLTRPPSTPERADRSPRSKRKHSRAASSSDTPSSEGVDEKKRSRRSKRNRDQSRDEAEKNHDSQDDQEVEFEDRDKPENEISQSSKPLTEAVTADETPMSTTSEATEGTTQSATEVKDSKVQNKSDADTTVTSPKADTQTDEAEVPQSGKETPERRRSESVEKFEVLEIHAELEDGKIEPSVSHEDKEPKDGEADTSRDQDKASRDGKVSISRGKFNKKVSEEQSAKKDLSKSTNKNDVVESSVSVEKKKQRKISTNSDKDESYGYKNKDPDRSDTNVSNQGETVPNGQAPPIVVNRKRKWGSRPKITTQKSITISTDVLKEIIPDVKPAEFDEVIDEKKHKRIEMSERIERPVLPKIIIDNTESIENRKEHENSKENIKKETNLSTNRRISIVKDNDIGRPPSPPRHKQSNILYITNLVRPFTLPQLKNLLQRTGRIMENGFWIDRIKSRCFVQYENEDQAVETRHALHGVTWPVSNPKTLQVDFSTPEAFEKARQCEESDTAPVSTIPGTVEDWLREQDQKREQGEVEKPWERKAAMREWDMGKNDKDKTNERLRRDDRPVDKRRQRTLERSPEPAKKFKKKEEEAPAKLLDDLFRKTKATPCIYWLPLSAETIAIKEEQRRQHMAEHERRLQELRRHREARERERDRRH